MASNEIVVTFSVRLPWWWRPYIYALKFFSDCGVLIVDPDVAGALIARHMKIDTRVAESRIDDRNICPEDDVSIWTGSDV